MTSTPSLAEMRNSLLLEDFRMFLSREMLRVNVLLMGNAILMGVMVGIGAYGHRYRHHPVTRFFFMGATILFLPIVSYIVSITRSQFTVAVTTNQDHTAGDCESNTHMIQILLWTAFVQIIGINTTAVVAADDREGVGRSIAPPAGLLVQAIWTTYLGFSITMSLAARYEFEAPSFLQHFNIFTAFALIFLKIVFKYYAWYSARQSVSFGRNPRLIVGYMSEHLPSVDASQHAAGGQHVPPPLIVSRENTMVVERHPHGYEIMSSSTNSSSRSTNKRGCLVTIDKVWELDDMILKSTAQLKDVCFSFALFKMLRCHFAMYKVTEAPGFLKVRDFVWHVLLEDSDGTRILGVIATELSFLHDYYYSSLPTSYSKDWLPISGIFISLLSIGYYLFAAIFVLRRIKSLLMPQIVCWVYFEGEGTEYAFAGKSMYDLLPFLSVVALVVLSEVREIASYVCSDWTKVALICRYVSWREYPTLQKWIGILLRPRCKLVRPWKDYMNQCSIIVLHPRKFRPENLLRRIIPLPEQKKSVKVPKEVKADIVNTLRDSSSSSSSSSRGDDLRACLVAWGSRDTLSQLRYLTSYKLT